MTMSDTVDPGYFDELAKRDPLEVCRRALCRFDSSTQTYLLSVWGQEYAIDSFNAAIVRKDPRNARVGNLMGLFILYYLLYGKEMEASGEWISEKEVPGGAAFFRGPHAIPSRLIAERCGEDLEEFKKRCRRLSGTPLKMADVAFRFVITPRIPVAVLFWEGDEEFPAEAKLLFDRTIAQQFPPDVIFSLAVEICDRIGTEKNAREADNSQREEAT